MPFWASRAADNKDVSALGKQPIASHAGGGLTLAFSCLNAASRNGATLVIEHSGNIGQGDSWSSVAIPETSGTVDGVNFTVTPNGTSNQIIATIPVGEALAGKLFTRLRAFAINL